MFIDDWGNEYNTYEETIEGIHKICKERDYYWEIISEYMCIDKDIMNWIVANHLDSFQKHFAKQILEAENDWCETYIWGIEED